MAKNVQKLVGLRIREFRERQHLSQEELAERADLHRTYIGQVERGEKSIGITNLFRIARALGVQAADLLRGLSL